jgi:hypothetical protein
MNPDDKQRRQREAMAWLDAFHERASRYAKTKPSPLPANVVELPPCRLIDRAPLPMAMMFDTVCRIPDGEPISTRAEQYGAHLLWVADSFSRA